ncbi:hypothetical protein [Gulosibacter massiliensis]|uniref:hypothetical protein n=1 Tax=Gulosibacter massiliensis TaxID=2479839 RepID=UPI001F49BDC3|nr:hypothetical protein [Gulosibacter massiliensis]
MRGADLRERRPTALNRSGRQPLLRPSPCWPRASDPSHNDTFGHFLWTTAHSAAPHPHANATFGVPMTLVEGIGALEMGASTYD